MPGGPAQTPVIFLKGGGVQWTDQACAKALIKCGYDPSWFGSYDHVKKQIDGAKKKCSDFDNGKPGVPEPTESDRFLAGSQSGHVTQDAIWRKANGRDSPCDNHPTAKGNVTGLAPSMPHFGGSSASGSTHQRITVTEPAKAKETAGGPSGTPMNGQNIQDCAATTSDIAVDGAFRDSPRGSPKALLDKADDLTAERAKLEQRKKTEQAAKVKERERRTRQKGSDAAQQRSAAQLTKDKKVQAPATERQKKAAAKKAKECIEAFRKAGLDHMRKQVVQTHSTKNKQKNVEKAEASADAATAKRKAAEKNGEPKKRINELKKEEERAKKEAKEARRLRDRPDKDERCLQDQADDLEGKRLPTMTGEVPGRRPAAGSAGSASRKTKSK
jgi:hypothetical protein